MSDLWIEFARDKSIVCLANEATAAAVSETAGVLYGALMKRDATPRKQRRKRYAKVMPLDLVPARSEHVRLVRVSKHQSWRRRKRWNRADRWNQPNHQPPHGTSFVSRLYLSGRFGGAGFAPVMAVAAPTGGQLRWWSSLRWPKGTNEGQPNITFLEAAASWTVFKSSSEPFWTTEAFLQFSFGMARPALI